MMLLLVSEEVLGLVLQLSKKSSHQKMPQEDFLLVADARLTVVSVIAVCEDVPAVVCVCVCALTKPLLFFAIRF